MSNSTEEREAAGVHVFLLIIMVIAVFALFIIAKLNPEWLPGLAS